MKNLDKSLTIREFKVRVMTIPTLLEMKLYGTVPTLEVRTIQGYTLKDAKRRAGIQ